MAGDLFGQGQRGVERRIVDGDAGRHQLRHGVDQLLDAMLRHLAADMPTAKAASEAARRTGLPRKNLYQRLLELKPGSRG